MIPTIPMNRRHFIGAGSAALAAAVLTDSSRAAGATVRIGFIGVGNRGTVHVKNMLTLAGVQVTAICDIKPEHAQRAAGLVVEAGQPAPAITAEWRKLLERRDVDAVVSALPCDLHAACYLDTLAAGKDLYGEKPMCLTIADCDKVIAATKRSDRIVQIGFQRRADPRFTECMPQVHAGELGRIVEGRIAWSNAWGPLGDWFGQRRRSGDWMVEQACHNWDVMNWANQSEPVRAMGLGHADLFRDQQPDRDVHDYYSAVVQYPNGCIVNILHSWVPGTSFNAEHTLLMGTQATIEFNAGVFSYRRDLQRPNRKGYAYEGPIDNSKMALEAFIESVRTRRPPVANVEHGLSAVKSCLLVREAVYRGGVVTMDEILKA
jgi:myo-inositol 2-dehydrogenase / D-chiro-inositol 1-dehydrogenase